jgi:hypothetical protein
MSAQTDRARSPGAFSWRDPVHVIGGTIGVVVVFGLAFYLAVRFLA